MKFPIGSLRAVGLTTSLRFKPVSAGERRLELEVERKDEMTMVVKPKL